MPTWYRVYPHVPLDPAFAEGAKGIPGIRWTPFPRYSRYGHFTVPDHATPYIGAVLTRMNIPFSYTVHPPAGLFHGTTPEEGWAWAATVLEPLTRPGILDMLRPYQQEAVGRAAMRDGTLFDHATAAGKALTLILCSILRPGTVIFTTLASNCEQLAQEVRRFTYETPYVIGAEEAGETRAARLERQHRQIAKARDEELRLTEATARVIKQAEAARNRAAKARNPASAAKHTAAADKAHTRMVKLVQRREEVIAHREGIESDIAPTVENADTLDAYCARQRAINARPFVVVAHESLPSWRDRILAALQCITTIAVDEVHALKSYKRDAWVYDAQGERRVPVGLGTRATVIRDLCHLATYRYTGTATLAEDSGSDLYAPLDLTEPKAWGNTATAFRKRYCGAIPTGYEGALEDGPEITRPEELRARMAVCVHRVTKAQLAPYLPINQRIVTWLGPQHLGPAPDDYGEELRHAAKGGKTAEREVHLRSLAHMKDPVAIIKILARLTKGQKVIVFCGRRAHVESLNHKLHAALTLAFPSSPLPDGWAVHGETPPKRRELVRQAFQEHPGPAFLIGTGDAWGTGLNIQKAHYLLILHIDWMPGRIEQKEGRIHRPGGFNSETEYLLIHNSEESEIAGRVFDKVHAVRQLGANNLGAFREQLLGVENVEAVLDKLAGWLACGDDDPDDESSDESSEAPA